MTLAWMQEQQQVPRQLSEEVQQLPQTDQHHSNTSAALVIAMT
jgi:hypothetical protein